MTSNLLESPAADLGRLQDALEAAHARGQASYDALFNAPPEGLSVHEIANDMILTRVSPSHQRLLGYSPEQMTGRPASSFVILRESFEMAMGRKLSGNGALEPSIQAFLRADGSAVKLLQLDRRLLDDTGKVLGIRTALAELPSPPVSGSWPRPVPA